MRPAEEISSAKRPLWVTLALWQGVTAPLLLVLVAIVGGAMRPGYSHVTQAISELTEAGAADKPYLDPALLAMELLTIAFGLGFWWVVRRATMALRISAACMVFIGFLGLFFYYFPMDPMGTDMTFNGRMHLIIVTVSALAAILAVLASARGWFLTRGAWKMTVVSALALLVMVASGVLATLAGTLGWTGIGIWQRVNTGAFSVWQIATAIFLMRATGVYHPFDDPGAAHQGAKS